MKQEYNNYLIIYSHLIAIEVSMVVFFLGKKEYFSASLFLVMLMLSIFLAFRNFFLGLRK